MSTLIEQTLFGAVDKVAVAIERLRAHEPEAGYYVTFSGGKDSVVILDLVKRAGVKHDAHYNLTTVDPPELVYFIRREHPLVEIIKPKLTMWQLIRKYHAPPTRLQRWCCRVLKEGGGSGRVVVTGIRWAESLRRKQRRMVETCMTDATKTYIHPIIDWSDDDVWHYIRGNNLPYCSLYDEGFKRLGCVLCPMSRNSKIEMARWPKLADAYKRAFTAAYAYRIARGDGLRWKSGDDWFAWWLNRDAKTIRDQFVMFDDDGVEMAQETGI